MFQKNDVARVFTTRFALQALKTNDGRTKGSLPVAELATWHAAHRVAVHVHVDGIFRVVAAGEEPHESLALATKLTSVDAVYPSEETRNQYSNVLFWLPVRVLGIADS